MAQIATTTQSDPLGVPANTRIDRDPKTGYLYSLIKGTTAGTWELYRSINGGAAWSLHLSVTRASVQEWGGIFIANDGHLYTSYRTNEGSQDRIYFRRCRLANPVWGPETLTGNPANGGVAGAIHAGMDIQLVDTTTRYMYIVIAVGTTFSAVSGVTLYGVLLDQPAGTHTYNNSFLTGRRQWMDINGTFRIVPSVDLEHDGTTGKSSQNPHLWIAYGRQELRMVKLTWKGAGWAGPSTTQLLQTNLPAQDGITGRWDGQRWLMVVPHPSVTDTALVVERDRANSRTSLRQTPTHPAGVIRALSLSYNVSTAAGQTGTRDVRVYAVGTANADLYYTDFNRAAGTWTSWTTVTATDVLGANVNQFSVRRGAANDSRHTVAIGHAGSPNTVNSYHMTLNYAPDTPTWDTGAMGRDNGTAAEVSGSLLLAWTFSDQSPSDTQQLWALSRQIGTGTVQYLRASDSTWQATEQVNAGGTTSRTLAAGWGLTSDAPHSYKVKVWDNEGGAASLYSDAFVVLPSGKVNPTVTSPTEGQTIATDQVTVTWTAAEQTQYRVQLLIFGAILHDSGWRSGTDTTYVVPWVLTNTFSYSLLVQTRNLKGLASDAVQRNFSVAFVEPPRPAVTVVPQPAAGVIRVTAVNQAPAGTEPAFVSQELWRRPVTTPIVNSNPGFEGGSTAGWGPAVGGTGAPSTEQAQSGSWSYKVIPDGVSGIAYAETIKLLCTEGLTYDAYGWIRAVTAAKPTAVFMRWYNASNVLLGASIATVLPPAAGLWRARSQLAIAPAGATQMTLCAGVGSTPAITDIVYVDELRIRVADPSDGVRVAAGLAAGAVVDDWRAVSGVDYEYRAVVRAANGASAFGPWTP